MADLVTATGVWVTGILSVVVKNFIMIGIVVLVLLILYLKYGKPKPINEGKELFNRQYDAIDERLRFKTPKLLGLCVYPDKIEDLAKTPLYQLHYQPFGEIIGVNAYPILTHPESLFKLAEKGDSESYKKILAEFKEKFPNDNHWIVFAVKKKVGGKFLFSKVKKTLVWVKPSQIIDLNSRDNVVRVRGSGLGHIGLYDYITDEVAQVSHYQLESDLIKLISGRTNLRHWDLLGTITGKAMQGDSDWRKILASEGAKARSDKQPENTEAIT